MLDVAARSEIVAGNVLAITDHGPGRVSPARDMLLWSTSHLTSLVSACDKEVVAPSLPNMQELYRVQARPDFLKDRSPLKQAAQEIVWSPDAQLFAIHWTMVAHCAQPTPAGLVIKVEIASPRHGFSIHAAKDGRCLGRQEMLNPRGHIRFPCAGSKWDPTSSYLIYAGPNGTCARVDIARPTGAACMSTYQQRGFQPDPTRHALMRCYGSPSGRHVCVIDDYEDASKNTLAMFCAQVSILKATTGSIVYQYKAASRIGDATWLDEHDVCLLDQLGVILSAACTKPASLDPFTTATSLQPRAWRHLILPEACHPLDEIDACASAVCQSVQGHRFSRCGSIVVGMVYKVDGTLPLCHWHLAGGISSKAFVWGLSGIPMSTPPDMGSLVWHPQQHACVYAISDINQGIHIIDAKADRQLRVWPREKLMLLIAECGRAPPSSALADQPALAWSHDGSQLGVFFASMGVVLSF